MIDTKMLVSSAMVIPYFSKNTRKQENDIQKIFTPIIGRPNVSMDKFWYLDRKFFYRSGRKELIEVDNFDN